MGRRLRRVAAPRGASRCTRACPPAVAEEPQGSGFQPMKAGEIVRAFSVKKRIGPLLVEVEEQPFDDVAIQIF